MARDKTIAPCMYNKLHSVLPDLIGQLTHLTVGCGGYLLHSERYDVV